MTDISLVGGLLLTPDGQVEQGDLHLADGRIVATAPANAQVIDCTGRHVVPGIVDVHGDAFEMELHPRPGVDIDLKLAMSSVDRQLLSNGITTAYHGLTLSWEPGARSLAAGRAFMAGLAKLAGGFTADHRVQLRWETFAHDAIDDLSKWLAATPLPAIAFNDHTTLTLELMRNGQERRLSKWADRSGLSLDEYLAEAGAAAARAAAVPAKIRDVAQIAKRHGAVMLSHDERQVAERLDNRAIGMSVCEFPLTRDVAEAARAKGEHVVMGGPNVIRGGSHTGGMSAEDAVADGLCTILASDYFYPSLLHAVERIVANRRRSLAEAWALISANPAEAMGLDDRGTLAPGNRADILILDTSADWRIVHTIAGGTVLRFSR